MTVHLISSGSSKRYILQDRYAIFAHRRSAGNQASRVVEKNAMTEARGRMDVRLEYLRRRALETERELGATIVPKPMCDPMRLDGVEALEIQQRFNQAVARGGTVEDRQDI